MTTAPILFQPLATEITKVAASAAHRHPAIAGRIAKAAELLLSGALQLEPVAWQKGQDVRWHVASQSGRGAYVVCGLHCPCQDSRAHGLHCKHSIAISLYLKILANRLNVDLRIREIELGVWDMGQYSAYAKRMGIVQVTKLGREVEAYTFVSHASAAHYSLWLAKRRIERHPVAMAALTALAA